MFGGSFDLEVAAAKETRRELKVSQRASIRTYQVVLVWPLRVPQPHPQVALRARDIQAWQGKRYCALIVARSNLTTDMLTRLDSYRFEATMLQGYFVDNVAEEHEPLHFSLLYWDWQSGIGI